MTIQPHTSPTSGVMRTGSVDNSQGNALVMPGVHDLVSSLSFSNEHASVTTTKPLIMVPFMFVLSLAIVDNSFCAFVLLLLAYVSKVGGLSIETNSIYKLTLTTPHPPTPPSSKHHFPCFGLAFEKMGPHLNHTQEFGTVYWEGTIISMNIPLTIKEESYTYFLVVQCL